MTSLASFLWGGDEAFMASNQEEERTSSSTPVFFLGIVRKRPGEKAAPEGEYGNKLECSPSLDLLKGAGSVRTGAVWFDFRSMGSRFVCTSDDVETKSISTRG